jgi:hypothetical protein
VLRIQGVTTHVTTQVRHCAASLGAVPSTQRLHCQLLGL